MASSFTTNLQLEKIADNEQENTWGTTERRVKDETDTAITAIGTLTSTGGTNTVTSADFINSRLVLTGSLSADAIHLLPARAKHYARVTDSHTRNGNAVSIQPSGGTALTVPSAYDGPVFSDGTTASLPDKFIRGTAAGDVNMDGNDITNAGTFAATSAVTLGGVPYPTRAVLAHAQTIASARS